MGPVVTMAMTTATADKPLRCSRRRDRAQAKPVRSAASGGAVHPRALRAKPAQPALHAAALLRLVWLASPALPVGGFSYSEGLEAAVDAGLVHDEASAATWLLAQMQLTQQRSDWPLVASATRAWQRHDLDQVAALNQWSLHTRETRELRQQAQQMGRSLADWLRQRQPDDPRCQQLLALQPAPTWPLACALAAAQSGAPLREAVLALAFGWAENMVGAAIKAVPLGQSAGQRLLGRLAEALPAAVDAALAQSTLGAAGRLNFAPMLAVQSARHEAQYSRLFRS